ncbi:MAG TPA: cyclic pyranopterin monophosphate synthase MoaC [Bacteroidales bacterium]|jgi:cyclic pyranopterin phosphate synthase|nr:cyclic pyranopterin monophosphate synthase MoaC [Bacteroidales bacterium]
MDKLTHTDDSGKAIMVDIGSKEIQQRSAKASGHIRLSESTLKLIADNLIKKGDVLTVAQIAGINAAKATSALIPLCHNITLDNIAVNLFLNENGIVAESEVKCTGRTGAEMEALTAVSVALLTVYDMCKAVDSMMVLDRIMVTEKTKK